MLWRVSLLLWNLSYCFGALTLDDLIEDTSWVPVVDSARRADTPNEDLLRFQEGLAEATRKAKIGELNVTGSVDCFGLNPVLQYVFRWMFKPNSREKINARFYLVTKEVPWPKEIKIGAEQCSFDAFVGRNTAVIVHGFMSNGQVFWVNDMAEALITKDNYNVIIVDWAGGSESWKYWRAVANTRVVGLLLAQLLDNLVACRLLDLSQIHCIGHSLGSHICSFAARSLGPFGRITGLDPAEPCFKGNGLNLTDAKYVDVIHTNTAVFGRPDSIGRKDFYPNGGKLMPGCIIRGNVVLDKLNIVKQLEGAICSHGRSYEYFIDSIRDTCKFWGRSWDFTPNGGITAFKGECSPSACAPLGLESINYPGSGGYYVPTRDQTPFCIPDLEDTHKMDLWSKIRKWFLRHF